MSPQRMLGELRLLRDDDGRVAIQSKLVEIVAVNGDGFLRVEGVKARFVVHHGLVLKALFREGEAVRVIFRVEDLPENDHEKVVIPCGVQHLNEGFEF